MRILSMYLLINENIIEISVFLYTKHIITTWKMSQAGNLVIAHSLRNPIALGLGFQKIKKWFQLKKISVINNFEKHHQYSDFIFF